MPYIVVGIVHLVALAVGDGSLAQVTKPILMPALLVAFIMSLWPRRGAVVWLGTLALVFSWAGDYLLGTPGNIGFLAGLGAFFFAHIAYLVLFTRVLRRRRVPLLALAYVAWWLGLLAVLGPSLGSLFIPVALYGLVLGAMAGVALATSRLVAVGALVFLCSDTLLALKLFLPGFSIWQADFLIMLLYLAGQGIIIAGVLRMARAGFAARSVAGRE